MEEELIKLETAKLAKEKGFERAIKNTPRYEADGTISTSGFWDYNLAAPTQSLLQRWLREVHDIHITIYKETSKEYSASVGKDYSLGATLLFNQENEERMFKTYEQAFEAGLLEALKLIR